MPDETFICRNLKSTETYADDVADLIKAELDNGFIIGPFTAAPYEVFRTNPLGVVISQFRQLAPWAESHPQKIPPASRVIWN